VTVSGITGTGTLGIKLVDDDSIRDQAGNRLIQSGAAVAFGAQTTFSTGSPPSIVTAGDVDGTATLTW